MERVFRMMTVALVMSAILAIAGFGQYYQAATMDDMYYNSETGKLCEYALIRPDPIPIDTKHPGDGDYEQWMKLHVDETGALVRPTQITKADLPFLDILLGDSDIAGMWHQIEAYGPITDMYTISQIKIVSMSNAKNKLRPEPAWAYSLREGLILNFLFRLQPGTPDDGWPPRWVD